MANLQPHPPTISLIYNNPICHPPPPKPPTHRQSSSANQTGTPGPAQPLLARSEFSTLLMGHGGLVRSAGEAQRWLEAKGWILVGKPYDCMKLAHVLMTAAMISKGMKLENEVKNAVLAVAFLLEDDVNDKILNFLADAVTAKVLDRINPIFHRITSSLNFATASNTTQAETTLALTAVSAQLTAVSTSLGKTASKLSAPPPPASPAPLPTQPEPPHASWVSIAVASPTVVPAAFNPKVTLQHTHLQ
ncbi:hypothetical protein C0989_006460 [Termitomyces sp. Mn162]|nr:hypothetical protein C0989_006460 [Termitomyces sp. Mn162]